MDKTRPPRGLLLRWWLVSIPLELAVNQLGVAPFSGQWWAFQLTYCVLMVAHILVPVLDATWRKLHDEDD